MRAVPILSGAALAVALSVAAAPAGLKQDCAQGADPALAIAACTTIAEAADSSVTDRSRALSNRGLARHRQGDYRDALTDFDAALALDPGRPAPFNNRGNTRSSLGDPEGALADYDRAIALDAGYGNAHNGRANALCALGRAEESVAARLRALELGALTAQGIQRQLAKLGYLAGEPNGIADPATEKALAEWTRAGCPRP
jgi:tetratricopeptide (TPR) repeat protein